MATFLEHVNDLLVTVGELEAPDFQGIASRKAVLSWQKAIRFVSNTMRWRHLRSQVNPSSWVGFNVAIVPAYQSIIGVYLGDPSPSTGTTKLYRLEFQQIWLRRNLTPSTPCSWSERTETSIIMDPVKTTVRPRILVDLILAPTVPSLVSDVLTQPGNFLQCCELYAEAEMHRIHTTDATAYQQAMSAFEQQLQLERSREGSDLPSYWRM